MHKYFDKAEIWLRSAPVVKMFTIGFINPRQLVAPVTTSTTLPSAAY